MTCWCASPARHIRASNNSSNCDSVLGCLVGWVVAFARIVADHTAAGHTAAVPDTVAGCPCHRCGFLHHVLLACVRQYLGCHMVAGRELDKLVGKMVAWGVVGRAFGPGEVPCIAWEEAGPDTVLGLLLALEVGLSLPSRGLVLVVGAAVARA